MTMVGGLCLFLFGMNLAKEGLQLVAGDRLRTILHSLTERRLMAVGVGAMATAIIQSSTATTVMLVGFASAGLITLTQAMGILLGADIGTTVTVQLISLHVTDYALWLVILGFVVGRVGASKKRIYVGQAILGFGFIFYSMALMVSATEPIRDSPALKTVLQTLADYPIYALAGAALLTAAIQSSAAVVGLVLSLALSGAMTLHAAVPMILGANIGTTATALLSSTGADVTGKRVAWAHVGFKVAGALLVFPFIDQFVWVVHAWTDLLAHWTGRPETGIARQVAWTHTIFNLGISAVFFPFVPLGANLLMRALPDKRAGKEEFRPKYLDPHALDTPALAFGSAVREMLRMADLVQEMLDDFATLLKTNDPDLIATIHAKDDLADMLDESIRVYLTKLSRGNFTEEQAKTEMQVIALTSDLENIGDIIDKHLLEICEKKIRLSVRFSEEGWNEILDFHGKVRENFVLAVTAYTNKDQELAHKVLRHKKRLAALEQELREAHIKRLHAGLKESFDTSSMHLDLLSNLRRINSYITGFAYAVLDQRRHTAEAV
ncbi:MAG TPA: Na/Pi cotransporter family protein [bacterium]|nr:Na/Pi cotransporter family protein [bacterium]